mmetsp:Transcript_24370/g.47929  ORF Transcript_24370/g.47929 Transcript_24370/m.47929 type:complete len:240 (-) Transcript_24370:343-1062(-)
MRQALQREVREQADDVSRVQAGRQEVRYAVCEEEVLEQDEPSILVEFGKLFWGGVGLSQQRCCLVDAHLLQALLHLHFRWGQSERAERCLRRHNTAIPGGGQMQTFFEGHSLHDLLVQQTSDLHTVSGKSNDVVPTADHRCRCFPPHNGRSVRWLATVVDEDRQVVGSVQQQLPGADTQAARCSPFHRYHHFRDGRELHILQRVFLLIGYTQHCRCVPCHSNRCLWYSKLFARSHKRIL